MADNSATLQTNKTNWEGRSGAPATRRPWSPLNGNDGLAVFSGNASTTVFNIPHGIVNAAGNGIVPGYFDGTAWTPSPSPPRRSPPPPPTSW